ncbi:hypothetical protein C8Q78DRAFT_975839 [Trametes maxima]|nr:hypothetical protein C8Q78DRAFT_975839 [Trametes maxima]
MIRPPPFLFLELQLSQEAVHNVSTRRHITLSTGDIPCTWRLCSVIYLGEAHFTCRFIERNGNAWYHDGISTGSSCVLDGTIDTISLASARGRLATHFIYRLE